MSGAGKKKKQPPPNAFLFFMKEFQATERERGRHYSMKECAELLGDEWRNLPPEEKLVYQRMADEAKHRIRSEKYNSKGEAIHLIEQKEFEKEQAIKAMYVDIESTLQHLARDGTLKEQSFNLIHINYFCKTDKGDFIPCELALVEFNLKDGIKRVMHTFISSSRNIPTGYRSSAIEHCSDTHRTPLDLMKSDNTLLKSKAANQILKLIMDFLNPAIIGPGEYPPLYTMPDEVHVSLNESCVKGVINFQCDMNGMDPSTFKVYNLPKLFFGLRNITNKVPFPSITFALDELEKDVFKYTDGIACDFHEEEDVSHFCSRSIAQRWAYVICDHCCTDIGIEMRPGFHCPKRADLDGPMHQRMAMAQQAKAKKAPPKEDRNSNYMPTGINIQDPVLREPHRSTSTMSRASNFRDSETSSIRSSSSVNSILLSRASYAVNASEGVLDEEKTDAKPKKSAWGATCSGWNKVASTASDSVPHFDNTDDFPSIASANVSRSSQNPWVRGRGRGRTLAPDFANLQLE